MKVHEKAKLYDELLKDYEDLLNELTKFNKDLEELPDRADLIAEKEKGQSYYYAVTVGAFRAMPFGLDMKLHRYKGMLDWYKRQK